MNTQTKYTDFLFEVTKSTGEKFTMSVTAETYEKALEDADMLLDDGETLDPIPVQQLAA